MPIAHFGETASGEAVGQVSLRGGGLHAKLLTYGARLQDLRIEGLAHPLILGGESMATYVGVGRYWGAIVGRFANRIAGGRFSLEGNTYALDTNWRGGHSLHGGAQGAAQQIWQIEDLQEDRVTFALNLAEGHMGYPGQLEVRATYALLDPGLLSLKIESRSQAVTPASFAPHAYFNLSGSVDLSDHALRLDAPAYLPVDPDLIPTGEVREVAGSPFDFRQARGLNQAPPLDHNFCLASARRALKPVSWLSAGGLSMELSTSEPGLQLHDAGGLAQGTLGLEGRVYGPRAGLALEPQVWPDAPNQPHFPTPWLRPGETLVQETQFAFRLN